MQLGPRTARATTAARPEAALTRPRSTLADRSSGPACSTSRLPALAGHQVIVAPSRGTAWPPTGRRSRLGSPAGGVELIMTPSTLHTCWPRAGSEPAGAVLGAKFWSAREKGTSDSQAAVQPASLQPRASAAVRWYQLASDWLVSTPARRWPPGACGMASPTATSTPTSQNLAGTSHSGARSHLSLMRLRRRCSAA